LTTTFLNETLDSESLSIIQRVVADSNKVRQDSVLASAKLGAMHLELAKLQLEVNRAEQSESVVRLLLDSATIKLETLLSRINYNYGKDIDPNKLSGINVDFKRYRKILYIKEITRVKYTDTLLYYLQEILKTLYGVPARLLVIEPRDSYSRASLYPKCKPHTELTYAGVYTEDIFMAGYQQKLTESILSNPGEVDYLLILDRSCTDTPFVVGAGVETIYTVSDMKDIKFSCKLNALLSYSKDTLHVKYIKDFDEMSMEEKITAYSSMSTVQHLINVLERGD